MAKEEAETSIPIRVKLVHKTTDQLPRLTGLDEGASEPEGTLPMRTLTMRLTRTRATVLTDA